LLILAPNERRAKRSLGQSGVGYVRECLNAAQQHPEMLPSVFNVSEFEKDVRLLESMEPLTAKLNELSQMFADTRMRLGQEALEQAGVVYDAVKTHTKRNNDLKPLESRLKEFYKRSSATPVQKSQPVS
jgi:hypothetical protein